MPDRIAEIKRRVGIYKTMPCGPTRQLMIEDLDYLLAVIDTASRELYRQQQELERRLARVESMQSQDDVDWLTVCGQKKDEDDDRSGCY